MTSKAKAAYLMIICVLVLAACQAQPASPAPVVETLVVTEVVEATPVEVILVVTPTPEPGGPRTLVICVENEPEDLNQWGTKPAILEALFEGGWNPVFDTNSFSFQPIILEKLPSLGDGDAILTVVTVRDGDTVVDANDEVVVLDTSAVPPQMLIPAGGVDPVPYEGGEFAINQLSATFKMLPDLLWSDGTPMTAADSVYAAERQKEFDGGRYVGKRTASYEAIDDLTIVWTGLPGFRDSIFNTNFKDPVPEHIWSKYSDDELLTAEETTRTPVGWGPFIVEEWVQGERILMNRNPNYFRAEEGLPRMDTIIVRFVGSNTNENIAALLSGECDIVSTGLDNQTELLIDLGRSGQIKASFTTGTVWEHIDFGIQHVDYDDGYQIGVDRPDFFSDVRTRQAFAMCMDRQALVDNILFGQSLLLDSYLPPQHPLHNPNVPIYEFDVAAGSALLEEVGWIDEDGDPSTPRTAQGVANVPDGTPLEVDYETSLAPIRQQTTAILQETLAQCGIKTNVKLYTSSEWFADGPEGKLFGRRFDLGQYSWITDFFPPCDLYLSNTVTGAEGETWISIQDGVERLSGGWDGPNAPGFANEEYDAVCVRALGSFPGLPEYESANMEAQRIFAEQLPTVPLFLRIKLAATRPDMCGFIMDPTANSEFWNIEEFDYGEGCEQ